MKWTKLQLCTGMTLMTTNVISTLKVEGSTFEEIEKVQGAEEIIASNADYIVDESKIAGGSAEWVFFPKTESEVVAIINRMREEKIPITISGGRTGIVGSAVPFGGAVISTDKMTSVLGLGYDEDVEKYFVRIQPGITLKNLDDFIRYKEFTDDHNLVPNNDIVQKFKQNPDTFLFPVDPTEMTAVVGGSIAANASGARSYKYGAMRPWVRHLRVVLDSGEVLDLTRGENKADNGVFVFKKSGKEIEVKLPTYKMPKAKNAAGFYATPDMDVMELFIGTEGILGVITEVDLWIIKKPMGLPNVMFFTAEDDSILFVEKLREDPDLNVEYMEFFDENSFELLKSKQKTTPALANLSTIPSDAKTAIFFEIPYSEDTLEDIIVKLDEIAMGCNSSIDSCWSAFDEVEKESFKAMRHAVPESVNAIIAKRKNEYPGIHKLGTDMSVEHQHFRDMMNLYHDKMLEHGLEYVMWGHIGDSHVHLNILPRNMEELALGKKLYKTFAEKAVEFGGSVSAEHGIGKIKIEYLIVMYGEEGVDQMRAVKQALDPQAIFNRGNMFTL
ncbi:MAG: FAD-binding oxidoreductase [Candidatus Heimdallarchaeota archaeon]|nr:FAD-binding oxidoreductase [Candidatus Heimdallarchaeota archaeon]